MALVVLPHAWHLPAWVSVFVLCIGLLAWQLLRRQQQRNVELRAGVGDRQVPLSEEERRRLKALGYVE